MEEHMLEIANKSGPNWDYFKDITRKWINCLRSKSNINIIDMDILKSDSSSSTLDNNSKISVSDDSSNKPILEMVKLNKKPISKKVRVKTNSKFNILSRNILSSSKTQLRKDMKLPKLTAEEEKEIERIIDVSGKETTKELFKEFYESYGLTTDEKCKLSDLNERISSSRLVAGGETLNISGEPEKDTKGKHVTFMLDDDDDENRKELFTKPDDFMDDNGLTQLESAKSYLKSEESSNRMPHDDNEFYNRYMTNYDRLISSHEQETGQYSDNDTNRHSRGETDKIEQNIESLRDYLRTFRVNDKSEIKESDEVVSTITDGNVEKDVIKSHLDHTNNDELRMMDTIEFHNLRMNRFLDDSFKCTYP